MWNALLKRLLSVAVRAQVNRHTTRLWIVELVFYGTPLPSAHHKEQGLRRAVYLQYDLMPVDQFGKTIDSLLNDWSKIVYLYALVHDFSEKYKNGKAIQFPNYFFLFIYLTSKLQINTTFRTS